MSDNVKKIVIALLTIVIVVGAFLWFNRGYGSVSPKAYEFSKAIYGACLAKSDARLNKIEAMIEDPAAEDLPLREHKWLMDIINTGRADQWESAAKQARSMMEDQASVR